MKQKIIVTALPNGESSNRGVKNLKVSAAISLQVEDATAILQSVPDMLNWASLIKNASFTVQMNGTNIEAKVANPSPIDTDLWKKLFAPSVKVRSFVQEDLSTMPIASYPVKHIVNYIKDMVEQMGKSFANDLPTSNFFTEDPKLTAISDYAVGEFPKRGREKITLNKIVADKQTGRRVKSLLKQSRAIPFSATASPSFDFAQLKNFHGLYDNKEVNHFKQVEKPDFEFHDILSILSGYPQLMRKLGLVIDLEFAEPPLRLGANPAIRIIPSGINYSIPTVVSCPPTAYTKTTRGFYAKADTGSLIDKGHLKINTDAFTVFQVDTDGAALKLCQQVDALQLKKAKNYLNAYEGFMPSAALIPLFSNEAPPKEGAPSHRTVGIAVAKNGMATSLVKKFDRLNKLKSALITPGSNAGSFTGTNATFILSSEVLSADDVNLGYRMDIQTETKPGDWFSLHERENRYSFISSGGSNINIPDVMNDEGYIQIGATEENTTEGKQLKVGEVIARWEGWSLSVPRPGSALNDPTLDPKEAYDKNNAADRVNEEKKYKTPATADFKLNVIPGIKKGSLPMLRFGRKYAIKVRTVDLAGNSVDRGFKPENEPEAVVNNIRYLRYEPVDAPFLVLGTDVKDGESSEVMVIRSNEGIPVSDYEASNIDKKYKKPYKAESVRHVKPPRCTIEMATTHAMLDAGFTPAPANQAKAADYYQRIVNDKDPEGKVENNTPAQKVVETINSVEYLADPMAAGVTIFLSANDPNFKLPNPEVLTKRVSFYFDDEVTSDAQANQPVDTLAWMKPKTFKIVLKEGPPGINWIKSTRTLEVNMMKGLIFKFNYACFWRPNDILKHSGILNMMGMSNLADAVGQRIARGQHWMCSPWREITFVHAVQQPLSQVNGVKYPQIAQLVPDREYGDNTASLHTKFLVHGPTTDKLDIEASWTEWVDDVLKDELEKPLMRSKVMHFSTLYAVFEYVFGEIVKGNPFPAIKHLFNDTKHRMVNYKCIATTRYRENFYQLIEDRKELFRLTRESTVVPNINILSSARPAAPQVEYVIPTFEWDRVTKGKTTLSARGSGLRVYLKRPWYSSGEGEQLAVILKLPSIPTIAQPSTTGVSFTTWGTDPTKVSAAMPTPIYPIASSFINVKPENIANSLSVVENKEAKVWIVAYDVKFDTERKLYYVDLMMNIGSAYYPFVRLALARYQKHSLRKDNTDCCLSPIFQTDYIQVPAPRASFITFGNSKNMVSVGMSGTVAAVPTPPEYRTKIEIIIEPIEVPSTESAHITINAKPIDTHTYVLAPGDINNFAFQHGHEFKLPDIYATTPYRVKVMEYELITYDNLKPHSGPAMGGLPMKERLVFADVYEVNK